MQRIFKLQKRTARMTTISDYSNRSTHVFETQWQPIKIIFHKRELLMMFNVLKGIAPIYLKMLFHVCNNTSYSLRSNNLKIGTHGVHVGSVASHGNLIRYIVATEHRIKIFLIIIR